jgi:outer membrane protein
MRKLAILLILAALPAAADDAPRVLTLEQALATAREHAPQLRQAHATTEASVARSDQSKAPLLPQVAGTGSYSRSTANYVSRPGSLPGNISGSSSSSSWSTSGYYNLGLSASQLVYDFGATSGKWRASQANATAQRDTETATLVTVLAGVRDAFFTARAAKALVTVAQETLDNREKHLQQVQAFVEVGTKPEIDLAQARADRANALVSLIAAQNQYETAKAQLNQVMGVETPTDFDVAADTMPPVPGEDQGLDALLDEAISNRPELAAAAQEIRAQQLSVGALKATLLPSLEASTGFTDAGASAGNLTWNWNVGLGLSVPIFQGGQTKAQIREAEWTLASLQAQADSLRLQVRFEVDQARLGVRAAQAALEAAKDALVNAQELLRLAEGRYEIGVGSIIELSDAQVALTSAAQQRVQAEYKLAQARSALQKAIGRP